MVINHNLAASNANRMLGLVAGKQTKNMERLSSGYKINRAGDDSAGLSISEKMRYQIRGLNRASDNAQDGVSYIQVAEGALNELHSVLQRGRELAVQAANDTNTAEDRTAIKEEIDAITKEVNRIARDTKFNTMNIFDSSNARDSRSADGMRLADGTFVPFSITFGDLASNVTGAISTAAANGKTFTVGGLQTFATAIRDNYLPTLLGKITNGLSTSATPSIAGMEIGLNMYYENSSTLAYVSSNGAKYQLGINMRYLTETGGNIAMTADLATTIAHEMTHAVMFDINTNGLLGSNGANRLPMWFIEGTAQAVGGAKNYVPGNLASQSDSYISNYLSKLTDTSNPYNAYAQGYLGSMYLGYAAGTNGSCTGPVTAATIASGLDRILKDISDGYSLSESIYRQTNHRYSDLAGFESGFANDGVQFVRDLYAAIGSGTGSIISPAGLSGDKNSLLTASGTSNYFTLDIDNTWKDNWPAMQTAGVYPWTGGGATTTNGSARDGSTNPNASPHFGGQTGSSNVQNSNPLLLQVGSLSGQTIQLNRFKLSAQDIGLANLDISTNALAGAAINSFDQGITTVSEIRSYYGALQNRLEHTIANLDNSSENTQAAESRIRDTDMAEEMVEYSKHNILLQSGQSMLAQANQLPNGVMSLLQ